MDNIEEVTLDAALRAQSLDLNLGGETGLTPGWGEGRDSVFGFESERRALFCSFICGRLRKEAISRLLGRTQEGKTFSLPCRTMILGGNRLSLVHPFRTIKNDRLPCDTYNICVLISTRSGRSLSTLRGGQLSSLIRVFRRSCTSVMRRRFGGSRLRQASWSAPPLP